MSLVGPRPLPIDDVKNESWLSNIPEHEQQKYRDWLRDRLTVMPGVTGLWQISGKSDSDLDNWVEQDYKYLNTHSAFIDFKILVLTPFLILKNKKKS